MILWGLKSLVIPLRVDSIKPPSVDNSLVVESKDLTNDAAEDALGIELLSNGIESCKMLYQGLAPEILDGPNRATYARVEILLGTREDITIVLRPVRAAWELINNGVSNAVV